MSPDRNFKRLGYTNQLVMQYFISTDRVRLLLQHLPDDLILLPPLPHLRPTLDIKTIEAQAGVTWCKESSTYKADYNRGSRAATPEDNHLRILLEANQPKEKSYGRKGPTDPFRTEPPYSENPNSKSVAKATKIKSQHHSFRNRGFNCNGVLAGEDSRFDDMDELATQPSTQPFLDPRRDGNNSMLSEDDECDVMCILHPGSPAAYQAVDLISEVSPQHILQNRNLSRILDEAGESIIDNNGRESPTNHHESACDVVDGNMRRRSGSKGSGHAMDIALRLSSKLINPCLGFTFGRTAKKCDILLSRDDESNTISGMHFRIFVNKSGVLMLEDTSTNGTIVDSTLLRGGKPRPGCETKRMISGGSIIELMLTTHEEKKKTEILRFIVTVPSRNHAGERYGQNMANYLEWLKQTERQADVLAKAACDGNAIAVPPVPLNPLANNPWRLAAPDPEATRNLAAGSETYHHGMAWNGGEEYNVVGYIGKGAFANVYKLATKRDGELFAAKQIEKRRFIKNNVLDQKISNEMRIMRDLSHPNIVQFCSYHETARHYFIIMEFVPYGDLTPYTNSKSTLAEYLCQIIAHQICDALRYLHQSKVTHRDIKPDNILIKSQDPLVVKLSDFGLSKVVTNEDEFLKTFCGTLLYCAPEIYPGYNRYLSGLSRKRTRSDDPPLRTSPYKEYVDVWAFAAVLYHLLCGSPPYEGPTEDRGSTMLDNIMQTPVDYERLKNAGVSSTGIDFLSKMLVLDPNQRATETECLKHAWIVRMDCDKPPEPGTQGVTKIHSAVDEAANALDASLLSLDENHNRQEIEDSDEGLSTDMGEVKNVHISKRFKLDGEDVPRQRPELPPSHHISYPSLPKQQIVSVHSESHPPTKPRLFGEIGASALRSSGVLGYDAHAALQVPFKGSRDGTFGASRLQNVSYLADDRVTSDGFSHHYLQYPQTLPNPAFTGSAPSLFGAEALVGELNMASPESGGSVPSPDSVHAPKTPDSRDPSPLSTSAAPGSKRSSQVFRAEGDQTTSKRAKSNHPIRASQRSQQANPLSKADDNDNGDRKDRHNLERSSSPSACTSIHDKVEGDDNTDSQDASQNAIPITAPDENISKLARPVKADDYATAEHVADSTLSTKSPFPTAHHAIATVKPTFVTPPPRLGNLTAIPGSICDTVIRLEQRTTCYGRDPASHVQHRDTMDTRIPKNALDIIFWRPGLEALIDSGKQWSTVEDLFAILVTRTNRSIKVNGVKLTKGEKCWNYGRLYTGDIITIFGPPEGEHAEGRAAEYLKFRCEFFVGLSVRPREEGSPPFVVEKEEEKFPENRRRQSQGSLGSQGSNKGGSQLSSQFASQNSPAGSQANPAGESQGISPPPGSQTEQPAEKSDDNVALAAAGQAQPKRGARHAPHAA